MNKIFLTGIVSTIGAAGLALSGCGAGVPESKEALIEEGLKKIVESSSFSGTLSQNSNINFTVAGKDINLNLNYNMDIEQMLPDGASHVKGNAELTVSGFKENTTTEMYMVPNGDNTDIYTGSKLLSDDDMTWDVYSVKNRATTSEVDPKTVIEVLNGIKNVIDKLELKEGTEKYDGNDCYVITGSYTIADLSNGNDAINKAFAGGLSFLTGSNSSQNILGDATFTSDIFFDKRTHEIKGIRIDMGDSLSNILNSLIGAVSDKTANGKTSISMDNTVVEFKINGYNNMDAVSYTHLTPERTNVVVTKKWDDNNNQDRVRPGADEFASKLHLLADGTEVDGVTAEVVDNNDGTYTVTYSDILKYENGNIIVYGITEDDIAGYSSAQDVVYEGEVLVNVHKVKENNGENGGNKDNTDNNSKNNLNNKSDKKVDTADHSNNMIYYVLIVISATGIISAAAVAGRKKH